MAETAPPAIHDSHAAPPPRCIGCRYDLAGLPTSGVCPECALPIRDSLVKPLLRYADQRWLNRAILGLTLWHRGLDAIAVLTVLSLASAMLLAFVLVGSPPIVETIIGVALWVVALGIIGAMLAMLTGTFLLSSRPVNVPGPPVSASAYSTLRVTGPVFFTACALSGAGGFARNTAPELWLGLCAIFQMNGLALLWSLDRIRADLWPRTQAAGRTPSVSSTRRAAVLAVVAVLCLIGWLVHARRVNAGLAFGASPGFGAVLFFLAFMVQRSSRLPAALRAERDAARNTLSL